MKSKTPCHKCLFYNEQTFASTGSISFYCGRGHTEKFLTQFNPNTCPDYTKDKSKKQLPVILQQTSFKQNYKAEKTLKWDVSDTYITGYYD